MRFQSKAASRACAVLIASFAAWSVSADVIDLKLGASFSECNRIIAAVELLAEEHRSDGLSAAGNTFQEYRVVAEGIDAARKLCPAEWYSRDLFSRPYASYQPGLFDSPD